MLTLYHTPPAICGQKNRVCLAEKGVAWTSENLGGNYRSPEYLKLNPGGFVPTLVHDGKVITESRVIDEYIDETFDGPALQPADPYQRSVMRRWTKQIDDPLHPMIFVMSFAGLFRKRIIGLPQAEQRALLPLDPLRADRMVNLIELGWESPYVSIAIRRFEKLAIDLEAALCQSEWIAGNSYSLADADYTPYLQRMQDLGLDWLWETRPALSNWYAQVRSRPSFAAVTADWADANERAATEARSPEIGTHLRRILEAAKTGATA